MLDLAAVLDLAEACAPGVAPETLAAVAYVESRFDPLAIGVNRGPAPPLRARSRAQAVAATRALLARGANLDLGLAQINSANLPWLGLSIEDAFDPCRNLAASATVLRAGYRPAGAEPAHRQAALRVALSRYNTGHPNRGLRNGYVARVEAAAARLSLTRPIAADAPAPGGPIRLAAEPPPPSWDVFARARGGAVITVSTEPIGSSSP
ncbi:lytic transglycosylase domain-containing protein [Brevundimonas sp. BAL450]|uniref:lytic transglycosylase domain-containing protein n=1 Tax=Brevundimonas sp. BAL450 TaxID=1708162 RepID=UPI0018CAB4B2|nr:lytic transglycosylase domain-containing protein [Brevundimonas sp. BAL450]MBG7614676.1 lytic transglycosylase domain-containing protein [Brevundimonas sp. BAL450]